MFERHFLSWEGGFFPTSYLIISLCFNNLGNGCRRYMINVCLANIFEVEEIEILSKSAIVNLQALFSN
jgi:hypothetical protein